MPLGENQKESLTGSYVDAKLKICQVLYVNRVTRGVCIQLMNPER